jgi:hypothetical protein
VPVSDDFAGARVLIRFERETMTQGTRLSFRWKSAQ